MDGTVASNAGTIPEQKDVSWRTAYGISWAGLKRRFLRALITMSGVILAIAFLSYMLINDAITNALIAADVNELNIILQQTGVDIFSGGGTDKMMLLLIGLSLLTCLVGIINSMLMSVTERVREIGTLKCLGARDSFIVKSYLIESSLQGVIGAVIGMFGGLLVAVVVGIANYKGYVLSHFPFVNVVLALGISFVCGSILSVFAAIGPAYMAAKKQPVDALRVEE
jgi:ABC-type antimicrobial peptide transport system permease subunit